MNQDGCARYPADCRVDLQSLVVIPHVVDNQLHTVHVQSLKVPEAITMDISRP